MYLLNLYYSICIYIYIYVCVCVCVCDWQLPVEVCKLFNVTAILHTPAGVGNARVSRQYRASFTSTLLLYPVSICIKRL